MARPFLLIFLCLAFCFNSEAQEAFSWQNLTLDKSLASEAVKLLGQPKKDKTETLPAWKDNNVKSKPTERITFRRLTFKNIREFDEVVLSFKDDRLVEFSFEPKKKTMPATHLPEKFKGDFLFIEKLPKVLNIDSLEGQKETTVPKIYPAHYHMLSVKPKVFFIALIDNNSWKTVWRDVINQPTAEMFPGYVAKFQVFSRSFQQK